MERQKLIEKTCKTADAGFSAHPHWFRINKFTRDKTESWTIERVLGNVILRIEERKKERAKCDC